LRVGKWILLDGEIAWEEIINVEQIETRQYPKLQIPDNNIYIDDGVLVQANSD
jgi:uncharacterized pyridoxamine 5'-phosphate oxidase family protein